MIAYQAEQRVLIENVITRYYDQAREAARLLSEEAAQGQPGFEPAYRLPPMTERLSRFLGASDVAPDPLGEYRGHRLALLNMMGNPGTRTTKTFASLLMVARAVHHIQQTGRRSSSSPPRPPSNSTSRPARWRTAGPGWNSSGHPPRSPTARSTACGRCSTAPAAERLRPDRRHVEAPDST